MVWDEENRLRGINDNGKLHLYTYDHTGERALKSSGESSTVVTNGLTSAVITHMDDYTAYVNPYFVVQKGRFTKHYFEGSSRIVSKLGEGTFVHKNTGIMAGGIDYIRQSAQMQEARDRYIKGSLTPPGPPTQHGIYASPEWTGQPYPSLGWQNIRQDQEPPEGWPRPPKFNEPGDVPGPPVQYGDPITPQTVKAGYGFIDNGIIEKNLYFYHPDHLGSSSYITDREGRITQHTEYIAFGEVLFEEHSTSRTMPYMFNGKELDQETNLTYFGARYLDMKTSLWLNTDPLSGYNPIQETEHYIDGQHNNGVFNPMNMATYSYTYQNPIKWVDPNGKQALAGALLGAFTEYASIIGERMIFENKSFSQAHNDWDWKDTSDVVISFGVGWVSGTAKFAKFMSSSAGKRVVKEIGTSIVEGFIKLGVELVMDNNKEMTQVEAEKIIIGTLVEFGLGKILPTPAKKNLEDANKLVEYYKKPKYWKAQQAKTTQEGAKMLNETGKAVNGTTEKITGKRAEEQVEKYRKNDN